MKHCASVHVQKGQYKNLTPLDLIFCSLQVLIVNPRYPTHCTIFIWQDLLQSKEEQLHISSVCVDLRLNLIIKLKPVNWKAIICAQVPHLPLF